MKRCVLIVLTVLLACVGCARQTPFTPSASAGGSASASGAVVIATTDDPATKALAELYAQGLVAKGHTARIVEVSGDTNTLVSRLMAGELDLAPAYAWTAAQTLEVDSSDPSALVSDLARALDGEVAVLQPSQVDHGWRYLAKAPGHALSELTGTDRVVGPAAWLKAPDGPEGLATIYGKRPKVETVDDSAARAEQVRAGAIGVFEGTDPAAADLQAVEDPLGMVASDPQVALLRTELSSDDTVLDVVQQLHGKLDNAALMSMRSRAATIGLTEAVAEWLKANPLT
ncbi:glycine betaine ABC transporter substrate-binding protein [Micropruina sp.]|uniref:glycine betaine ABC transporter substrate-binding protein n=1 Tax=Micropruina sp. TaxID=2737536 RepID=UPI0039E21A50